MGRRGLKMNIFILNIFFYVFCIERRFDEGYDLLFSVCRRGYVFDEVSYIILITGYFSDKKVGRVLNVWKEMKDEGIILSVVIYNVVIKGFCKLGKIN